MFVKSVAFVGLRNLLMWKRIKPVKSDSYINQISVFGLHRTQYFFIITPNLANSVWGKKVLWQSREIHKWTAWAKHRMYYSSLCM